MLSYQHSYHAGGPADVHKHVALVLLLGHLTAKAKPATVIDLYAGNGVYALTAPAAQKTGEYQDGIAKLWADKNPPAVLAAFLATVKHLNPGALSLYPGSPDIARQMLRPDDHLILNELHPTAFTALKGWVGHDQRIAVHKRDGLEALLALVPPAIRRGLVLIDPSFEMKTDYTDIPERLAKAVTKWREGIFMIWYPVLGDARHRPLLNGIAQITAPSFCAELTFTQPSSDKGPSDKGPSDKGLRGTGIIVINPPWKFDDEMAAAGKALGKVLGAKSFEKWLRPQS